MGGRSFAPQELLDSYPRRFPLQEHLKPVAQEIHQRLPRQAVRVGGVPFLSHFEPLHRQNEVPTLPQDAMNLRDNLGGICAMVQCVGAEHNAEPSVTEGDLLSRCTVNLYPFGVVIELLISFAQRVHTMALAGQEMEHRADATPHIQNRSIVSQSQQPLQDTPMAITLPIRLDLVFIPLELSGPVSLECEFGSLLG